MNSEVYIYLAIAVVIIAMAFLLTVAFRKTGKRDKQQEDPNGDPRDGDAAATWIGINHTDGD